MIQGKQTGTGASYRQKKKLHIRRGLYYLLSFETAFRFRQLMEGFIAAANGGITSISGEQWAFTLRNFSNAHEGRLRRISRPRRQSCICSNCCT